MRILLWQSVLMVFAVQIAHAVEPMSDSDLSAVSGKDGIAIGLEYGVNTDPSGNPLSELNCGLASNCSFAWKIAQREDGGGAWTVFKNSWMSLSIPVLNIDVQPRMESVGSKTTYFDLARFQGYDASGNSVCLLPGADCSTTKIDNLPALKLFYPAASYNNTNYSAGVSTGYDSLAAGLHIGRMSLEFGATGYLNDNNTNSFLGANVADNNGNFAMMAIGGTAYVYGF